MTVTAGDLQTLIYRALLEAGERVTTAGAHAAADTALAAFAAGIAAEDLAKWAPPPRPALMVDLHEAVPWACWTRPARLAPLLRSFADRLDGTDRSELPDAC